MPRTHSEFWTATTDARLASYLDSLGTLLWDSRQRHSFATIPESAAMQTKPQMAMEMLKRAVAADLPRGVVLADAAYGDSAAFRAEVRALLLHYVVGVHRTTRVIPAGSAEPVSIQALVDSQTLDFRRVQWPEGSDRALPPPGAWHYLSRTNFRSAYT